MKKIALFLLSIGIIGLIQAQVSKTVSVFDPGSLSSLLKKKEKEKITNLTINGTINAKDFFFMRDSMPMLSVIDISTVTIDRLGKDLENKIPQFAFCNPKTYKGKSTLQSITLP